MNRKGHSRLVAKLVAVAVIMFAFGFVVMPPLYEVFCDLTGLGGRGVKIQQAQRGSARRRSRVVKVRFDATVHSGLDWEFQAKEHTAMVPLGEMSEALYLAMNPGDEAIVGQAIYNVTPPEASLYFVKTECFCFTQQLLRPMETREMPVYYFIQPDLPDHIRELTLSYTFYRDDSEAAVELAAAAGHRSE